MRLQERLIKGTALNLIAMSFNQGSTLVASILVARILKKQTFGEYAMVYTTLLTAVTLAQLAMGYTSSKYVAEYRTSDPQRAGRVLGSCAIVSTMMAAMGTAVLISVSPWLASTVLRAPNLSLPLVYGSGFLFFSAINGYQSGALSGLEAFGSLAKAGVISGILSIMAISVGALQGGLTGAILGLGVGALIRCVLHSIWLNKETLRHGIMTQYRGSLRHEKDILHKFALPAALAGYYSLPMIWLANSFLVRQPGGYGEMAIYASAASLRMLVLFIPQVMNNVTLPILNNIKSDGDRLSYGRIFMSNVRIVFFATLVGGLFIGLFGGVLLAAFGKDFSGGKVVLQVLMVSTVFEGVAISLYQQLQAQERLWESFFFVNIPREALFLALAFLLVPSHGALGLSIAYACCWLLAMGIIMLLVYRDRARFGRTVEPVSN